MGVNGDHLGNIRLSYKDFNKDGTITQNEIVEEKNYYPFGLEHKGYNFGINGSKHNYGYQDQELNKNLGYNMHEFELRHYDASIGRFVTTDPYEQFMSPYVAMGNNPITSFDPDGGHCLDANGNQIACPDGAGDLYDDVKDSETNHIEILDEVVVDGGGDDSSNSGNIDLAFYGGEKIASSIGDMDGFDKLFAEAQDNIPWLFGRRKSYDGRFFVNPSGNSIGIVPIGAPVNLPFGPGSAKTVATKSIHFMQSSIKNTTGEYTVLGNAKSLTNGMLNPEILRISIWKDANGKIWTLDHRRLAAFKLSGLDEVPVRWATSSEVQKQMWKMSTKTNGTTIRLKLGDGKNMIIK
ncbi:RHS repeat-associated protein [Aquimarina sp. MAR_2010_214]|uniref:RHS repeat-associated core domain-containing protein n=1 Tax=Aquimarina sp. MAR_2010_214 TaxID=1250026 RepID=UPI000C70108D|nr:RHS repeat-associated core domain-containing protein [Aquimarina sp. MAR_2010_214]PKV50693.1 RHS repeat-associated protein [Aquimarina sp. MAR_2010_214]